MFWFLTRNVISDKAIAFFNSFNGNGNSNSNNSSGNRNKGNSIVSKNVGYDRLPSQDDFQFEDQDDDSLKSSKCPRHHFSSTSDFEDEFSEDSDYDEEFTCNVCDRSFYNRKLLERHQQKKRHFGCSACDTLFTTVMQLEHHKEEFDHWSDSETTALTCQHDCDQHGDLQDDDDDSFLESGEEMERLI